MMRGHASLLGWTVMALVAVATVLHASLLVLNRDAEVPPAFGFRGDTILVALPMSSCAALVIARRPGNPIGWLMATAGLAMSMEGLSEEYGIWAVVTHQSDLPAGDIAAWVHEWVWAFALVIVTPGLLLFPAGALPSHRWRPILWLSLPGVVALALVDGLTPGPLSEAPYVDNPAGVDSGALPVLEGLTYGFMMLFLVPVSAAAPIARFRGATDEQRKQVKWLALAGALIAAIFGPGLVLSGSDDATIREAAEVAVLVAITSLPVAITIAILRHRLYDIDFLINRTIVYGVLSLVTAGAYLVLVIGLSFAIRALAGQGSNEIAVAATTLIVAAIFQPARRRIQSVVDRRFYRAHYNAEQTLEAFQSRLRDQTDIDSIRSELGATVQAALQPRNVGIWLRPGGSGRNDLVSAGAYRNERTE